MLSVKDISQLKDFLSEITEIYAATHWSVLSVCKCNCIKQDLNIKLLLNTQKSD